MKNVVNKLLNSKRALIAFNIQNIYQLNALHQLSVAKGLPVIAQFSSKYIPYFDQLYGLGQLVKKYQNDLMFFHLDHCLDETLIRYCVDSGFASVMFDGSSLELKKNITMTNAIYEYASAHGALLEAELGSITGVEDGFGEEHGDYYSVQDLLVFAKKARYDMLALAIGNAHGLYTSTADIKIEKLQEAKDLIGDVPFVLHGGTGMPDEMVMQAISHGVMKINVSTALKIEYAKILNSYSKKNKSYDEFKFSQYVNAELAAFYESYILKFTV